MFRRGQRGPSPSGSYSFTDRTRRVLQLCREEAVRLGHEHVGSEHVLLGLIRERGGVGCQVLRNLLSIELDQLRAVVESAAGTGKRRSANPDLPYTSHAKRVIELAMQEARDLKHPHVGTEHLLLGLLGNGRSVAARVLNEQGLTLEKARGEVRRLLAGAPGTLVEHPPATDEPAPRFTVRIDDTSQHSIYEQIIEQVQEAVATQRLRPGDRLPTVRQLADELDIAPGTVARAYGELERLSVVITEGVRGTRVAERRPAGAPSPPDAEALVGLLRPVAVAAFHLGATADQLRSALERAMAGIFSP